MLVETSADRAAALRILGTPPMHMNMAGLRGADQCIHVLAGSGVPVTDLEDDDSRDSWLAGPYRHHLFTEVDKWCVCGNSPGNEVHRECWNTCDDCGRDDGLHNGVEHWPLPFWNLQPATSRK